MRILRFNEVNLNLAELEKTSKEGGIRGDVLVRKLKQQTENPEDKKAQLTFNPKDKKGEVTSVDNPEEIIDNITDGPNQNFDIEKAKDFFMRRGKYLPVFNTDDRDYKLNDVEKTEEFGSSGGSSLGSKETRNVESIQCLYCSLRQNLGRPINRNDFEEFFDISGYIKEELLEDIKVMIDITPEMLENYEKRWGDTFITTANALFEYRQTYKVKGEKKSVLDDRKKYIFYQNGFNGGLNLTIQKAFKSFFKMQIAKWNPSDIWVVNKVLANQIQESISRSNSIDNLNNRMDRYFRMRDLVGVSLKKVRNINSAELLINKVTERPTYEFIKVRTSYNPLNSLGVNILLKQKSELESENREISIVIRTFGGKDRLADVSGEILGSSSRHGKIGLTEINSIFSRVSKDIPLVPSYRFLKNISDEEIYQEIVHLNDYIGEVGDKSKQMKSEKTSTKVRLISKYQALLVAKNLYEFEEFRDEICKMIMYYGLAIENSKFVCPMYVRVL